jgi:hypothetical protein
LNKVALVGTILFWEQFYYSPGQFYYSLGQFYCSPGEFYFGLYFQNVVGQFYYSVGQFYIRYNCIFGVVPLVQSYFIALPLVCILKMLWGSSSIV